MGSDLTLRRVAIAVRNLDRAQELFGLLFGAEFEPPSRPTGPEVRCLELPRDDGEPTVELVEPVDPDYAIARFIRKHGEGIHHLSFTTRNLEGSLKRLSRAGGRILRTSSYYRGAGGGPLVEAFLHPKDFHGVLLHLAEPG